MSFNVNKLKELLLNINKPFNIVHIPQYKLKLSLDEIAKLCNKKGFQ